MMKKTEYERLFFKAQCSNLENVIEIFTFEKMKNIVVMGRDQNLQIFKLERGMVSKKPSFSFNIGDSSWQLNSLKIGDDRLISLTTHQMSVMRIYPAKVEREKRFDVSRNSQLWNMYCEIDEKRVVVESDDESMNRFITIMNFETGEVEKICDMGEMEGFGFSWEYEFPQCVIRCLTRTNCIFFDFFDARDQKHCALFNVDTGVVLADHFVSEDPNECTYALSSFVNKYGQEVLVYCGLNIYLFHVGKRTPLKYLDRNKQPLLENSEFGFGVQSIKAIGGDYSLLGLNQCTFCLLKHTENTFSVVDVQKLSEEADSIKSIKVWNVSRYGFSFSTILTQGKYEFHRYSGLTINVGNGIQAEKDRKERLSFVFDGDYSKEFMIKISSPFMLLPRIFFCI